MKPDRTNYEIWFIDWLDGTLSDQQVKMLYAFLSENPDLQEEFDSLSIVSLKPENRTFTGKDKLRKSVTDISASNFEHLCIAHLENDLNPEQTSELQEIIASDTEKRKTFELFQNVRLTPPAFTFSKKNHLKKITPEAKIIRLAAIGLSAAATIAIILMMNFGSSSDSEQKIVQTAQNIIKDTLQIKTPEVIARVTVNNSRSLNHEHKITFAESHIKVTESGSFPEQHEAVQITSDVVRIERETGINKLKVDLPGDLSLNHSQKTFALASFTPEIFSSYPEDERSNVDRFVARFFHKIIMRDTIMVDRPLKSYEIAEAGILGLNKLLGWGMALEKSKDENGEIKSLYFSSKYLKFNSPVKKSEDAL